MRMNGPELVILTPRMPDLKEWQCAIDAADFWTVFIFSERQPDSVQGIWHGVLLGRPVRFNLSAASFRAPANRRDLKAHRYELSVSNTGELEQCVASVIALWAALDATSGVPYVREGAVTYPPLELRKFADGLIAHAFELEREYLARYPSDAPDAAVEVRVTTVRPL